MNIEEGLGVTSGNGPQPEVANYDHGYRASAVSKERPTSRGSGMLPWCAPLPCCGIGIGWLLFILSFFFGIPWYIGAIMLCCMKHNDKREKPGFIACAVFAVFATIAIIVAVVITSQNNSNDN